MIDKLRNIAIIAHVDHGKTTLVDQMLRQSGTCGQRVEMAERVMDSNDLEKERGITILAKNTAVQWGEYHINIIDTPGHADFGGEVERILSMADAVLLLVDAVDGPMPQTRFVTQKAFAWGLKPIVVVNKIDRDGARPDWVVDQVFDLFVSLDATDAQLDFSVVFTSAINGHATLDIQQPNDTLEPLFTTIVEQVSPPDVDVDGPFQMQVSSLDYSSYIGAIGIGRVSRGSITTNTPVTLINGEGKKRSVRILQLFNFMGLKRNEIAKADAGDIIAITGIDNLRISDTLCDPQQVEALPTLLVDEPTVSMAFKVNTSPFAGKDGKFVTSRQIKERLDRELIANVALQVEAGEDSDTFMVSGRGELHLSILIETMRREGFELAVGKPKVIKHEVDGKLCEPYESLIVDVEEGHQGTIMQQLAERKGDLKNMQPDGKGRVKLEYIIPTQGLIGLHAKFLTYTSGSGLMHHVFDHYGPCVEKIAGRNRGVLIANCAGTSTGFSLWNLQERGQLFIGPQVAVYEGMIVGIHSRGRDLVVNVIKGKQLTNVRASGTDENIVLTPALRYSLEQSLDFIEEDELVEVTPASIRMRKKILTESDRKRLSRK